MSTTYYRLEQHKRTPEYEQVIAGFSRETVGPLPLPLLDRPLADEAVREIEAKENFERFVESLGPAARQTGTHPCVLRVLGEQCRHGYASRECQVPDTDHASMWKYKGGFVYVSQPYGDKDDPRLPRWRTWATERGLELEFIPDGSWWSPGGGELWNPGGTVLLLFRRASP
jgi:hypothetical protein